MIGLSVDLDARRIEVPQNTADVGVEVGTDIIAQSVRFPVLRGEDEMDVNLGERLRLCLPPEPFQGSSLFLNSYPGRDDETVPPWAGSCGPSGRDAWAQRVFSHRKRSIPSGFSSSVIGPMLAIKTQIAARRAAPTLTSQPKSYNTRYFSSTVSSTSTPVPGRSGISTYPSFMVMGFFASCRLISPVLTLNSTK